jgi:hypothetical protein
MGGYSLQSGETRFAHQFGVEPVDDVEQRDV